MMELPGFVEKHVLQFGTALYSTPTMSRGNVEEFRSQDELEDVMDAPSAVLGVFPREHSDGFSPERSIGGADLSGILPFDDEDDFVEFASSIVQDSTSAPSPLKPSASFLDEAGRNLALGDQLALEQRAAESEDWDSDDGSGGDGAIVPGTTAGRQDAVAGVGSGAASTSREPGKRPSAPSGDSSTGGSACSNPNVSSPTRPGEEGSDWDAGASRSSNDDAESEGGQRRPLTSSRDVRWSKATVEIARDHADSSGGAEPPSKVSPASSPWMQGQRSPLSEVGERNAAVSSTGSGADTPASGTPVFPGKHGFRRASPSPPPSEHPSGAAKVISALQGGVSRQRAGAKRPGRARSSDGETVMRKAFPVAAGSGTNETPEEEEVGALTAAATIEALKAELSHLREHVLRSEKKREAQMRELDTRLEAQERRSVPSAGRAGADRAVSGTSRSAALGIGGIAEGRRYGNTDDISTPQGAAFHNPFAATAGGAATPRDHFPAFEDALHDGGGEGVTQGEADRGRAEDGTDKCLIRNSEAFDFSIDTLSHINNHTDFGTDAPTEAPPPVVSAPSPPGIEGESEAAATRRNKARLPWALTGSSGPDVKGGLGAGDEADEIFDAKDTAAEEAFFADACATASLKTPVKHVLAAGVFDVGFCARRVRLDGRSARGTPAERCGADSSAPTAGGRPIPSSGGERKREEVAEASFGRPPHTREKARSTNSNCVGSPLDPGSPELCMADVFARASAELRDSEEERDGGWGGGRSPARLEATSEKGDGAACPPTVERKRTVGVDAASQTTWSFAADEEVRMVSARVRAPVRAPMGDGAVSRQDAECFHWNLGGCSGGEGEASSSEVFGAAHAYDGRGSCRTPRRVRPPLWKDAGGGCARPGFAEPPQPGVSVTSEASALFNSPDLSPIASARPLPYDASSGDEGVGDHVQRRVSRGSGRGRNEKSREACDEGVRVSALRRRRHAGGHGLSTIISDAGGSGSSVGSEARLAFGRQAPADSVDGAAEVLNEETNRTGAGHKVGDDRPGRTAIWGGEDAACSGNLRGSRATVDRSSNKGAALFVGSSVDVTKSSLLRASTTLETIAPLDDTSQSLSFHSRAGVSFPGELFADSRLPVSVAAERPTRYEMYLRQQEHLQRGDAVALPPSLVQQHPQQPRPRSAPMLMSDPPVRSRFEPEQLAGGTTGEPPVVAGGVPAAVVGAWLTAAIDGIFYQAAGGDSGGGDGGGGGGGVGGQADKHGPMEASQESGRDGMPFSGAAFNPEPAQVRSALRDARQTRSTPTTAPRGVRHVGVPGEGARHNNYNRTIGASANAGSRDDSPPPPPPPPPSHTLVGDGEGEGDDDTGNEEDMFYQRQRLLQRVVSAAASHGGVVRLSARDAAAAVANADTASAFAWEEKEGVEATVKGVPWRRHSDPLSWKTPPVAMGEVDRVGSKSSADAASRWATRGTPTYLRRHTSGYWRDRLGMTQ